MTITEADMIKKGVIVDASSLIDKPKHIISISPAIDIGLNGGIPEGSWVNITGKQKCGKTVLALYIIRKAQMLANGCRKAFYMDVEHRLKPMHLNMEGLILASDSEPDGLKIVRSSKDKILDAEEVLATAEEIIKTYENAVLVVDSTSALCSSKERVDDLTGQTRSLGPKLLATFCRRMAPIVNIQNTILILITHLIANTSGYGSPFMEDSGNKIQYQSDVKLRCKKSEAWETTEKKEIGKINNWYVEWSALGPPGGNIKSYLKYGLGIDEVRELMELGIDLGLITKSKAGGWHSLDFLSEESGKFQGQETVYDFIIQNESVRQELETQVKSML